MAITPTQVTVEELFGNKKYYVDFYQREYKWNDENHLNLKLFENEEEFVAQRNRLGGLLLLKWLDNQSSGNELYSEKTKTYLGNGTLFAQTLLPDFQHSNIGFRSFCKKHGLKFVVYTKFEGVSIEERQKLLFEMIKIIWA